MSTMPTRIEVNWTNWIYIHILELRHGWLPNFNFLLKKKTKNTNNKKREKNSTNQSNKNEWFCLCDLKVAYFTTFILNWVQQTTKNSRKQFREYTPVQVVAAFAPTAALYLPAAQSEKYANNNQIQTTTSENIIIMYCDKKSRWFRGKKQQNIQ